MTALPAYERIGGCGVVPVVTPPVPTVAAELAAALVEAGLPCVEITFRADGAPAAIERIRATSPAMLVGAGTVLTLAQVRAAINAGAQFLVSPGSNFAVVELALQEGIPILPGVATPSEVEANLARGIDVLKLFPAEVLGGVRLLKALHGPYRAVTFVPTGGIDPANLGAYLAQPNVLACGGSWIAPSATVAAGDMATVVRLAREAVELVRIARTAPGAASPG
jgi:2-dehydro-3-deoxyphosphogluconate aldolase/(4S)-4-hydroxy-2-oxoglutarate aldolase